MEKQTLTEAQYHALREMTRMTYGINFPYHATTDTDRWWIQAVHWRAIFDISYNHLRQLKYKGFIESRKRIGHGGHEVTDYRLTQSSFNDVATDLQNEIKAS